MKKKEFIVIAVLFILALGLYGFNYLKNAKAGSVTVRNMDTGEIVDNISLGKDGYYSYDGLYGKFNLEVKDKAVRAKDVECPNHSCEKMGSVSADSPGLGGIICIPNGFEVFLDE